MSYSIAKETKPEGGGLSPRGGGWEWGSVQPVV
jgi:hypothetical protein